MKKAKVPRRSKKTSSSEKEPVQARKRKSLFTDVLRFRWLKKALVGKTQTESLDLLDQWILKKKILYLFY